MTGGSPSWTKRKPPHEQRGACLYGKKMKTIMEKRWTHEKDGNNMKQLWKQWKQLWGSAEGWKQLWKKKGHNMKKTWNNYGQRWMKIHMGIRGIPKKMETHDEQHGNFK